MSAWELYWVLRLDNFLNIGHGFFVISIMVCIGLIVGGYIAYSEKTDSLGKKLHTIAKRYSIPLAIFFALIVTFLPTTKQYLTIVSVSYISQNEKIIMTGDKLFDVLDQYLDSKLRLVDGTKEPKK